MYGRKVWRFLNSNEYEFSYAGNYGAKGEKRQEKKKPTPEQVKKQNQANKENRIRRLIKANFMPSDLWITLKYPKGTRKTIDEAKADFKKFRDKLRYRYKRQDDVLKFIYRIEIGKRGGVHIHILVNRTRSGKGADILVTECWPHRGTHFTPIYEQGGYKELADYIAKPPPEEQADNEEADKTCYYSTSRNLVRPQPEKKEYKRWMMKKLINQIERGDLAKVATKGFYIDPDSIQIGVNRFTGMSYLRYTENRIKEIWSG